MCDCHDHPLEHAIWQALEAFDNGRPIVTVGAIVGQLRQDLEEWRSEQQEQARVRRLDRVMLEIARAEQASADGEVWPEPDLCGMCGHEIHNGDCPERIANHTFGVKGLDKPCPCTHGWGGNQ